MKKFFLAVFLFFILPLNAFAQTGISFIYINGSNIYNPKIHKRYVSWIQKFHPNIKNAFEHNPCAQKYFLKDGKYFIEKAPITFFWGDNCYSSTVRANKNSNGSKGFVTCLAYKIRLIAENVLHDIIWVQKHSNMNLVLDNLHKVVKAEVQKCNKIVLYGYSSGSFITYEYLLTRIPYINVAEFFNSANISKEQKDFVSQNPMKNTCMSTLEKELAVFSSGGHIVINNDFASFKKSYMKLNEETDTICIPDNAVIGVINLGSPLALFYSDISAPDFELTYYNRLLYKYILENDIFWLNVNYHEDPLSFPCRRNLTIEEIENITDLDIETHTGFIYDQSTVKGGFSALTHLSYLSTKKALPKSVVKAYVEGYSHQHGNGSKQKTINKCRKKIDVIP